MCYGGVAVDMSECQFSAPGLFSGRGGYDLVFNADMVKLL